jgi:hypothetical protein
VDITKPCRLAILAAANHEQTGSDSVLGVAIFSCFKYFPAKLEASPPYKYFGEIAPPPDIRTLINLFLP